MCCTISTGTGKSAGNAAATACRASTPPADAPMATTSNCGATSARPGIALPPLAVKAFPRPQALVVESQQHGVAEVDLELRLAPRDGVSAAIASLPATGADPATPRAVGGQRAVLDLGPGAQDTWIRDARRRRVRSIAASGEFRAADPARRAHDRVGGGDERPAALDVDRAARDEGGEPARRNERIHVESAVHRVG